jgi:hypothetical protein
VLVLHHFRIFFNVNMMRLAVLLSFDVMGSSLFSRIPVLGALWRVSVVGKDMAARVRH